MSFRDALLYPYFYLYYDLISNNHEGLNFTDIWEVCVFLLQKWHFLTLSMINNV